MMNFASFATAVDGAVRSQCPLARARMSNGIRWEGPHYIAELVRADGGALLCINLRGGNTQQSVALELSDADLAIAAATIEALFGDVAVLQASNR